MRRQPDNDSHKGTLFTFLDVLICTMGLLILLLVAIARQVSLQHAAEAAAKTPKVPASQFESEVLQLRIQALRIEREKADAELLKHRSILQQIEVRYRELEDQLAELEAAKANLLQLLAGESNSPHRAELARLQSRIVDLKAKLSEARARGVSQQPSFAIVPYEGPNGTRRRPIYIECRADKIVLQPEGIEFSEEDFAGSLGPGNPLAAGLRAAVDHVNRNRRTIEGDAGEGYPLLLIRPEGINAYYAARAALTSWGADFGYEFIDGDWKLDYGRPDPQLAKVELRAVEDARERQLQLAARDLGGGKGYGGPDFQGKYRVGQNGGLVRIDGGGEERRSFHVNPAGGGMVEDRGSRPSQGGRGYGGNSEKPTLASSGNSARPASSQQGDSRSHPTASAALRHRHKPPATPAAARARLDRNKHKRALEAARAAAHRSLAAAARRAWDNQGNRDSRATRPWLPTSNSRRSCRSRCSASTRRVRREEAAASRVWRKLAARIGVCPARAAIRTPLRGRFAFNVTRTSWCCYPTLPRPPGKEIPLGPHTSESVDDLVNAIWEHIDTWGIAGKGMYWKPTLHAEATPGGFARLSELKILLAGSGLVIHDKTEAARPAPAGSRSR